MSRTGNYSRSVRDAQLSMICREDSQYGMAGSLWTRGGNGQFVGQQSIQEGVIDLLMQDLLR